MDDVKILQPDYWTFIFEEPNNGWWLKINNANDLIYYHLKHNCIYGKALEDYIHNADKYEETYDLNSFDHKVTCAIVKFAEMRNLSIIDAILQFRLYVATNQISDIHEYGYILLNKHGGFHPGPVSYFQYVHRRNLIWPDFKESDIRITQFPGGTHWYVYIDDMELHEGENMKWMSESDARIAARKYINAYVK